MAEAAQSPDTEPNVPMPEQDNGGPASEEKLQRSAREGIGSRPPEKPSGTPPEGKGAAKKAPKAPRGASRTEAAGTSTPEEKSLEEKIEDFYKNLRPGSVLREAGNEWTLGQTYLEGLTGKQASELYSEIEREGIQAALAKYPNLKPTFQFVNQEGIRNVYNASEVKGMIHSTIVPPEAAAPPPPAEEKAPEPQSPPEKSLEAQIEERFAQVKRGTVLSLGEKHWKIDRIEEPKESNYHIKRYWTKRADGSPHYFIEKDVKDLIRDNLFEGQRVAEEKTAAIIRQEQATQQAAERAARDAARAEREKQLAAERDAKEAARAAKAHEEAALKEAFEKEKAERSKTFDDRVQQRLEALRQDDKFQRGKETLTFLKHETEVIEGYRFKDEKGQTHYLAEAEVNKLLSEQIKTEDKAALEAAKPIHQKERLAAAEKKEAKEPERPTPKWKERLEAARAASPIVNAVYEYTNRFLNKFDWRDKEKGWYVAGIATGIGSNVGLTLLTPFLSVGPGRIVRSAAYSGVLSGISIGANRFRNWSVEKILKDPTGLNIENSADRKLYTRKLDEAFRLLRSGKIEDYNNDVNETTKSIFIKHGKPEIGTDIESQAAQEARAALIERIGRLDLKYHKLNAAIRSFSAGLTVGTIGSTLGFGFFDGFKSLFERIHGGGQEVPAPGIEPGAPTHAPPVEAHTATPTPTPGFEHTPTPTPPTEVPHGIPTPEAPAGISTPEVSDFSDIIANPDLTHSLEIHSGDTVGQIFVGSGHEITWGAHDADLFGTHLYANYDMLKQMHDSVAGVGIAVEAFPAKEEIAGLIRAAADGDPVAIHRLTEALHWVPTGGNFNLLTPEGIDAARRALGLAG